MAKKLVYNVHVVDDNGDMHVFGPDSTEIPGWARKAITNPSAWGDDDESSTEEADDDPYKGLKKADLEDEVEKRNEGRDDEDLIVVGGNGTVADLKAALVADDARDSE